jgi:xylan 1,4-beta-xylosidase
MPAEFSCDLLDKAGPLPHYWEKVVGSCHATLALRADWQKQMTRCHAELGFQYVRFHGILCDDMGTLMDENDQLVYSFFNTDQIIDFLQSIGMRPFIEFSFMPSTLSSGPDIVFHYKGNITPPRDYDAWELLIQKLVQHWVDRYGVAEVREWFFEIWNEPNLSAFWKGSQADYFLLYRHAATAIKKVDEKLKVGGPATADNEWISDFYKYCSTNEIPFDFISTHQYPTDSFGKPGDDTITQLADSTPSVLRSEVIATKAQAKDKPLYYTEWSSSSNPFDALHDQAYAACFIIKTVMEARDMLEAYSYWVFSDIFEENYFSSMPFHGGFGLLNIYGIPKPAYRAFELLHELGDELLPVLGTHATVNSWSFRKGSQVQVLLTNFALPRHTLSDESVTITLTHVPMVTRGYLKRIDEHHANARSAWEKMGSPETLHPKDVENLEFVSSLVPEEMAINFEKGTVTINIILPAYATALITLETQPD